MISRPAATIVFSSMPEPKSRMTRSIPANVFVTRVFVVEFFYVVKSSDTRRARVCGNSVPAVSVLPPAGCMIKSHVARPLCSSRHGSAPYSSIPFHSPYTVWPDRASPL